MDDEELQILAEIHKDVRETSTQVQVVDERTKNIENRVDGLKEAVEKNRDDISELQERVERNTTIIGAVATGVGGMFLWALEKLSTVF